MKKFQYIFAALTAALTLSCKTEPVNHNIPVTSVELEVTQADCLVGQSIRCNALVKPEDATDKTVIWISSDEKVAAVDNGGLIQALKEGRAVITAITSDGGFEAECTVVVSSGRVTLDALDASEISASSALLKAGYDVVGGDYKSGECGFNLYRGDKLVKSIDAQLTVGKDEFKAQADGLTCLTGYEFEAFFKLDGETYTSSKSVFTTLDYNAPDKDGMNVKGIVYDAVTGAPLKDVVVSDGWQCVQTDANGCYYMKSDLSKAWNVFPITPAEYETSFKENCAWNGYKALDASATVNSCNFPLQSRGNESNSFRVILNGDPQPFTSASPHSIRSWMEVSRDIYDYSLTVSKPLYQIVLGDMVTNQIEVPGIADKYYFKYLQTCGVPSFHIPGNHDHKQKAETYEESIKDYSNAFGPYNYAFNLGGVHIICLDDCIWKASKTYDTGLNDEGIAFLENDLKFVPKDKPLIICAHAALTKWYSGVWPERLNFDRMAAALKGYDVHFFYGHGHINLGWTMTADEMVSKFPGVKSASGLLISRSCGCWCCSDQICKEGSPRGFVELDINGADVKWQFHSLVESFDDVTFTDNISYYVPGKFTGLGTHAKDDLLYCNVYIWDNAWDTPELWVGGKKAAVFTYQGASAFDPLYEKWFPVWEKMNIPGWRNTDGAEGPSNDCMHLFGVVPPTAHGEGEIRVSDRFGRILTAPVKW